MRSFWRALDARSRHGVVMTGLTVGLVGVTYGASAADVGFPLWFPMASAVTVVAGSSEFVLVGILTAGGGAVAAAAAGLLLNLRHLPYGIAVHDAVGTGWRKIPASHLLNDESVAVTLAQTSTAARRAALRLCGLAVLVCWPAGALLGALAGRWVSNPDTFGLDAVCPAVLATLIVPKLHGRIGLAALIGAMIAVGTGIVLPAGVPVLLALAALTALARRSRVGDTT